MAAGGWAAGGATPSRGVGVGGWSGESKGNWRSEAGGACSGGNVHVGAGVSAGKPGKNGVFVGKGVSVESGAPGEVGVSVGLAVPVEIAVFVGLGVFVGDGVLVNVGVIGGELGSDRKIRLASAEPYLSTRCPLSSKAIPSSTIRAARCAAWLRQPDWEPVRCALVLTISLEPLERMG